MTATKVVIVSADKKRSITADRTSSSKLYYFTCTVLSGPKKESTEEVFSSTKQKGHVYAVEEANKPYGHTIALPKAGRITNTAKPLKSMRTTKQDVLSPTETSSQLKFAEEERLMQDNYSTKEEEAKMSEEPEPHKDKGFNEMTGNPDPREDVLQKYHDVLISKNRNGWNAMEKPSIQDRKGLGGLIKRNSVHARVGNRKSFKWKQAIFDIMVNLGIALGFIYWHAMKDLDKFRKLLGVHCMAVNNEIGQYIGVKTTEYEKEFIRDHELEIWEEAKIFSIPGYHEEFHKGNEGQSVSKKQYSLLIGKIVFLVSKWITDCMTALRELSTFLDTVKWKMKSSNREDVKFGSQVGHVRQNATCHKEI
jgi:hypothetical protein